MLSESLPPSPLASPLASKPPSCLCLVPACSTPGPPRPSRPASLRSTTVSPPGPARPGPPRPGLLATRPALPHPALPRPATVSPPGPPHHPAGLARPATRPASPRPARHPARLAPPGLSQAVSPPSRPGHQAGLAPNHHRPATWPAPPRPASPPGRPRPGLLATRPRPARLAVQHISTSTTALLLARGACTAEHCMQFSGKLAQLLRVALQCRVLPKPAGSHLPGPSTLARRHLPDSAGPSPGRRCRAGPVPFRMRRACVRVGGLANAIGRPLPGCRRTWL